jgi:DNA-binding FadR family transcriptional regulator
VARSRKLADKYRELARRQRREARGKQPPQGKKPAKGGERTALKQQLFEETLARYQDRLSALEAKAGKKAGKSKSKAKPAGSTVRAPGKKSLVRKAKAATKTAAQSATIARMARRGAFVVRKTKKEILEMICVWGALESLAARLATKNASDKEIAALRETFVDVDDPSTALVEIDEYSEKNIRFHQSIIRLSKCELLQEIADGLFVHMRAIRARSVKERGQLSNSVVDHVHIIEALEKRDSKLAEQCVREHTNHLSEHVNKYVTWFE